MKIINLVLLVSMTLIMGCASRENYSPTPTVSDETRADLKQAINCRTVREDIKVLEKERDSVAKRIITGFRSIMPVVAAAGILLGDYNERVEVTTGQYNKDLERKIDSIKRCV
jgi:hypothetical protein